MGVCLEIVSFLNKYYQRRFVLTLCLQLVYYTNILYMDWWGSFSSNELLHTSVCLFGNFAKTGPLTFKTL